MEVELIHRMRPPLGQGGCGGFPPKGGRIHSFRYKE